ncbi:hypothetical protein [Actinoplanes sp. M2I2]|uniref:hypothetical protein n=1 Tax=Actinoplanes sp. M2I2 TaxID=1734444 RepID=UPI0020210E19|nr:hypothetical protein [Actinoplanes sp. M2I2]
MTTPPQPDDQQPTVPPAAAVPPASADDEPARDLPPAPMEGAPIGEAPSAPNGAAEPRSLRPWLLGGVAGAVIGALVVGILWAAGSFVGGDDAAEDAAAACGVFARVPDDWSRETVTEANTYQLGGAIALAQAAGRRDAEYGPLATQAQQVQQAVVAFDIDRVEQLVVDVRNTCDEL